MRTTKNVTTARLAAHVTTNTARKVPTPAPARPTRRARTSRRSSKGMEPWPPSMLVSRIRSRVIIGHGMLREGIHGQPCPAYCGEPGRAGGAGTTAAGSVDAGGPQPARPGGAADGAGGLGGGDRRADRLHRRAGEPDSAPLCRRRRGGVARSTEVGPAPDGERPPAGADCGPDAPAPGRGVTHWTTR